MFFYFVTFCFLSLIVSGSESYGYDIYPKLAMAHLAIPFT